MCKYNVYGGVVILDQVSYVCLVYLIALFKKNIYIHLLNPCDLKEQSPNVYIFI